MRVTQRNIQDSWIQNIQNRLNSLNGVNQQIGTGKRVELPSDDPSGANRIVRIEDVVARNEQYLRNISEAISVQGMAESALGQVGDRLVRVRGLAVEGASDGSNPTTGTLQAMAEEVGGIIGSILQLAGSTYRGEYLFSGTAGETVPYADGQYRYQGDSNALRVNTGNGQTVAVNLPGDLAFRETEARSEQPLVDPLALAADLTFSASDGSVTSNVTLPAAGGPYAPADVATAINAQFQTDGVNLAARVNADGTLSIAIADTQAGGEITLTDGPAGGLADVLGIPPGTKNVFTALSDLKAAFEAQDVEAVGRQLGRIDRLLDAVTSQRGQLGSRTRNLEFARDRLENYNVTSQTLKESIEGVDLPQAVMRLTAEEQAYQTSLAAGARIFNISIIDFLR
ncbi:MAG TPA: flagellar hook-associated protein FlgL [Deferrisomatales bacterium]|nr:flagellar hook-associated protein FlgL [Deferrisomatales bacterium]